MNLDAQALRHALSGALVHFVWQGAVVAAVLWLTLFLLRRAIPGSRYLASCAALGTLLLLPVLTTCALYESGAGTTSGSAPALTFTIRAAWSGAVSPWAAYLNGSHVWVLWIWLAGVLLLSLRLLSASRQLAKIRRSARPAEPAILAMAKTLALRIGTCRAVRVLTAQQGDGPSLIGWIRPAILLPVATVLNLTPQQLEAVLAHELAHLRRYDDLVNIFQAVVETVLFYHPAVWWVSGRIRQERELCCDDAAVAACGDAVSYARALTILEKLRTPAPRLALGAAHGPLAHRIHRLVDARATEYRTSSVAGLLGFCVALACAVVNTHPVLAERQPTQQRVEYPETARTNGVQGTVPVEVKVAPDGKVSGARALSGPVELRSAAVKQASTAQFPPASSATTKQVDVAFQLLAQANSPVKPAPESAAENKNTAALEGKVMSVAGLPLSKSVVSLYKTPQVLQSAQPSMAVKSDAEGKFVFEGLAAGTYVVTAEHPGYLIGANGSRRTTQLLIGFVDIPVPAGGRVTGITVELTPYSTISGKVVDEDGDPMAQVTVHAMIFRYLQGKRQLSTLAEAESDDRGEFKIPNLGPGRVYLSFLEHDPLGAAMRARSLKPGEPDERYMPMYYPGSSDPNTATPVTVIAGMDVPSLTMRMRKTAVFHVRGKVLGAIPAGPPVRVVVAKPESEYQNGRVAMAAPDGSFDVQGVAPGQYHISASQGQAREVDWLIDQPLTVGNRDATVSLQVLLPANLAVDVKVEDAAKSGESSASPGVSAKGIGITLLSGLARRTGSSGDDGKFVVTGLRPGKYTLEVTGIPFGGYLKSAIYVDRDVLDGLDVTSAGWEPLKIVVSMATANVSGNVTVEQGEQLTTVEMILIPDPPNPARPWMYKRQAGGVGGRFNIRGVVPGKYRLFAVEQVDRFVQFDPDWFKIHESRGVKITVEENGRPQLTVKRTSVSQLQDDERAAGR